MRFVDCSVDGILVLGNIALGRPHPGGFWGEQQVLFSNLVICHSSILHSLDSLNIAGLAASSRGLIRPLSLPLLIIISQHLVRGTWNTCSSHDESNKKSLTFSLD